MPNTCLQPFHLLCHFCFCSVIQQQGLRKDRTGTSWLLLLIGTQKSVSHGQQYLLSPRNRNEENVRVKNAPIKKVIPHIPASPILNKSGIWHWQNLYIHQTLLKCVQLCWLQRDIYGELETLKQSQTTQIFIFYIHTSKLNSSKS